MFSLGLIILSFTCILCEELPSNGNEKRLLLNDPDVVGKRLTDLENEQQRIKSDLQGRLDILERHIQKQDAIISSYQNPGATYIRWGRKQCPNSAELVYAGFAAGQNYEHSGANGGPANTLCLPEDPELLNVTFSSVSSPILGTEYQDNNFAPGSINNDMPCVVCRVINASTSLMIPARQNCYKGWRKEYVGVLAGGYHTHSASSYICVDSQPEYILSGEKNEDGHLMYVVNTQCSPLPCPPYHNHTKVTCVVCSK